MTNLQKTLQKMQGNEKVRANLQTAQDMFGQKPFASEYLKLHESLSSWGFLPSLLSIAGASLFFLTLFPNSSLWWVIPVGLVLATGYELGKGVASRIGFKAYLSGNRIGLALVIPAYLISATLSTWGAYNGYKLLENQTVQTAEKAHFSELEKSDADYESLISELEKRLKDFETQHTITKGADKGKISWVVKEDHAKLLADIRELKREKLQAKQAGKGQLQGVQENARETVGAYIYAALGISLLVEIVICLIAWFRVYYFYKSNTEVELIKQGEMYQIPLNTLRQLATLVQSHEPVQQLAPVAERKPAGFAQGATPSSEQDSRINTRVNPPINPPEHTKSLSEMIGYLAKYENVVNDLESGVSIRQTAERNEVSKSTVQNVRRCMNTLKAVEPFENPNA